MADDDAAAGFVVRCLDCDYVEPVPFRKQADHASRAHEFETGHETIVVPPD